MDKNPLDVFVYDYVGYSVPYTAVSNAYTTTLPTISPTTIGSKNSFTISTVIGSY